MDFKPPNAAKMIGIMNSYGKWTVNRVHAGAVLLSALTETLKKP